MNFCNEFDDPIVDLQAELKLIEQYNDQKLVHISSSKHTRKSFIEQTNKKSSKTNNDKYVTHVALTIARQFAKQYLLELTLRKMCLFALIIDSCFERDDCVKK